MQVNLSLDQLPDDSGSEVLRLPRDRRDMPFLQLSTNRDAGRGVRGWGFRRVTIPTLARTRLFAVLFYSRAPYSAWAAPLIVC